MAGQADNIPTQPQLKLEFELGLSLPMIIMISIIFFLSLYISKQPINYSYQEYGVEKSTGQANMAALGEKNATTGKLKMMHLEGKATVNADGKKEVHSTRNPPRFQGELESESESRYLETD